MAAVPCDHYLGANQYHLLRCTHVSTAVVMMPGLNRRLSATGWGKMDSDGGSTVGTVKLTEYITYGGLRRACLCTSERSGRRAHLDTPRWNRCLCGVWIEPVFHEDSNSVTSWG